MDPSVHVAYLRGKRYPASRGTIRADKLTTYFFVHSFAVAMNFDLSFFSN